MDFTTGEPSEEALSQLIKSLIEFVIAQELTVSAEAMEETVTG